MGVGGLVKAPVVGVDSCLIRNKNAQAVHHEVISELVSRGKHLKVEQYCRPLKQLIPIGEHATKQVERWLRML